jgi:Lar family restriction alleviation protein
MSTELLPCPFCGGKPKQSWRPGSTIEGAFVAFIACYCGGYSARAHQSAAASSQAEAEEKVLAQWNTRASPDRNAIVEACKALEDAPLEQLRDFQTQLDPHGEFVGVSRQALDEVLSVVFPIRALSSAPAKETT